MPSGNVNALIFAALRPEYFTDFYRTLDVGTAGSVTIVDNGRAACGWNA